MVINGASLPESLLEALGLQNSGSGFQIKLVRSGEMSTDPRRLRGKGVRACLRHSGCKDWGQLSEHVCVLRRAAGRGGL